MGGCSGLFKIGIPQTTSDFVTTLSVAIVAWTISSKASQLLPAYAVNMSYLGAVMLLETSISSAAIIRYASVSASEKVKIRSVNIIILMAFMGLQVLVQCLWPGFWGWIVSVSESTRNIAADYQWWVIALCGIELLSLALIGMLRAEGDVLFPAGMKAGFYLVFGVGLTFLLVKPAGMLPPFVGSVVSSMLTSVAFFLRMKKFNRKLARRIDIGVDI